MELRLVGRDAEVVRLAGEGALAIVAGPEDPLRGLRALVSFDRTVLLDLSRVDAVDSSGVSWLLLAHDTFAKGGGRLILHSLSRRLDDVLNVVGLSSVFHLAGDEGSALALAREAPR
jgi:anti-anti-sigma factor